MVKVQLREFFYISNILSLLRLVLIVPLYYLIKLDTSSGNYWAVFVMFLVALTDWLDGFLARKLKQQSDLGRVLDPVADKIGVAIVMLLLLQVRDLPVWYVAVIVGRDALIMLVSLTLMTRIEGVVESNWIGKFAVSTIGGVIIFYTLDVAIVKHIFMWLSVAMVFVSLVSYYLKMKHLLGGKQQAAG